jgi:hypothetical protein
MKSNFLKLTIPPTVIPVSTLIPLRQVKINLKNFFIKQVSARLGFPIERFYKINIKINKKTGMAIIDTEPLANPRILRCCLKFPSMSMTLPKKKKESKFRKRRNHNDISN